jgi:hypothetical protein
VREVVRSWINNLGTAPWQAPSIPFPELSDQPHYEVRSAAVPDSGGIEVFYRHDYIRDLVAPIWVR